MVSQYREEAGMSSEDVKQGRRMFGLRKGDGSDQEVELRVRAAEERAQSAEGRIGDLQAELVFYGDAIRSLRSELETMAERVVSRVAPQVVELEARNAETSAIRESVEATRGEVHAERELLMAWRRDLEQSVLSLRRDIEYARRVIDEMPERIREALTPAAESMAVVGSGMASLAGMPVPTSVLAGPVPPAAEVAAEQEPGPWPEMRPEPTEPQWAVEPEWATELEPARGSMADGYDVPGATGPGETGVDEAMHGAGGSFEQINW
jgi:hypothetical protein